MARFGSDKIRGHGMPEAIEAILTRGSRIEPKVAVLKPVSAAISIGTGGPFGAEGPIIMTGGALGSILAQHLHLTADERKTLLVAGAAGGMAATFNAPLASILLAVEAAVVRVAAPQPGSGHGRSRHRDRRAPIHPGERPNIPRRGTRHRNRLENRHVGPHHRLVRRRGRRRRDATGIPGRGCVRAAAVPLDVVAGNRWCRDRRGRADPAPSSGRRLRRDQRATHRPGRPVADRRHSCCEDSDLVTVIGFGHLWRVEPFRCRHG